MKLINYIGRLAYGWMFFCSVVLWLHFFHSVSMPINIAGTAALLAASLTTLALDYCSDLCVLFIRKKKPSKNHTFLVIWHLRLKSATQDNFKSSIVNRKS